jgi:hypothetical protein
MVKALRIFAWTAALVGLWASAEQGAQRQPAAQDQTQVGVPLHQAGPQRSSWEKLKNLFTLPSTDSVAVAARKGRP